MSLSDGFVDSTPDATVQGVYGYDLQRPTDEGSDDVLFGWSNSSDFGAFDVDTTYNKTKWLNLTRAWGETDLYFIYYLEPDTDGDPEWPQGNYGLTTDPNNASHPVFISDPYFNNTEPWRITGVNAEDDSIWQIQTSDYTQYIQFAPCCIVTDTPALNSVELLAYALTVPGDGQLTTDVSISQVFGANSSDNLFTGIPTPPKAGLSKSAKIGIGVGAAVGALLIMGIVLFFILRMRRSRKSHPIREDKSIVALGQPPLITVDGETDTSRSGKTHELNAVSKHRTPRVAELPLTSATNAAEVTHYHELEGDHGKKHEFISDKALEGEEEKTSA